MRPDKCSEKICIWRVNLVPDPVLRGEPCRWWIKNVWWLSSNWPYHGVGTCASVLTLRCSQISLFKGRKLILPPPPLSPSTLPLIIIHWWMIDFINQSRLSGAYCDCNTLRRLIQDGFFTTWKFKLFLIFGRMTLDFLFLSFSTLHSSSLWKTDTIFFAKLNKLPRPPSNKTPSLLNLSLNAFERN